MIIDNKHIRAHAIIGDDFHDTVRFLFSKLEGVPLERFVLIADHWENLPDNVFPVISDEHGVRVPKQAAQAIMDDLWQMGMRPSNYQDVVGAMDNHIKDLQRMLEAQYQQIVALLSKEK